MLRDFTKEKFDIIIQAGQSNAEGCGAGRADFPYVPKSEIMYLNNDFTISVATERIENNEVLSNFSLTFAERYMNRGRLADGRKLLIIRSAVGGTGFSDHHWGMQDDFYLRMMEMTRDALALNPENRIVAFLWHQGETDALNDVSYDDYYRNLSTLLKSVRDEFGEDIPFICGDFVKDWKDKNMAICDPIISAQKDLVKNSSDSFFVETYNLKSNNQMGIFPGDEIHFCREGQYYLGWLYYEAYLEILTRKIK